MVIERTRSCEAGLPHCRRSRRRCCVVASNFDRDSSRPTQDVLPGVRVSRRGWRADPVPVRGAWDSAVSTRPVGIVRESGGRGVEFGVSAVVPLTRPFHGGCWDQRVDRAATSSKTVAKVTHQSCTPSARAHLALPRRLDQGQGHHRPLLGDGKSHDEAHGSQLEEVLGLYEDRVGRGSQCREHAVDFHRVASHPREVRGCRRSSDRRPPQQQVRGVHQRGCESGHAPRQGEHQLEGTRLSRGSRHRCRGGSDNRQPPGDCRSLGLLGRRVGMG